MKGDEVQILKPDIFPKLNFFKHLKQGTGFYQKRKYERAIEEYAAASWLHFVEPVKLKETGTPLLFTGAFNEIPLLFFIYAIYINKLSGIGVIKSSTDHRKFIFKNGDLIRAASTQKKDRIGNFIIQKDILTSEKLDILEVESKKKGIRIGSMLIEKKLMTEKTLRDLLALQTEEIFSDSMFWIEGQFFFKEKEISESAIVKYQPLKIAWISSHRGFNFQDFRKEIPNNKIIFKPAPYIEKDKEKIIKKLDANFQFLFYLIDGTRNIDQLIQFSGNDEVSVINLLYKLNTLGLIRKTKEIGEYEDKAFTEVKMILGVLFDNYHIVVDELTNELGKYGKEVIQKTQSELSKNHRKVFKGISLDNPDEMEIKTVLQNIAPDFPFPESRYIFIDAFLDVFRKSLEELKEFLGIGLRTKTMNKMKIIIDNLERFTMDTTLKSHLMKNLKDLIK